MKVVRATLVTGCEIQVKAISFRDEFGQDIEGEEIESILINGVEVNLDSESMSKLRNIISANLTVEDYE